MNHCIEQLIKDSPYVKTIMAQHLCMAQPQTRKELILTHRNLVNEKIEPLRQEIRDYVISEDTKHNKQRLVRKIIVYIILSTGLGNPGEAQILKEVTFALGSVFDDKDVLKFCELGKNGREKELEYLTNLVTGIRIFNEKSGKTYSGMLDCKFNIFIFLHD